MKYTCVILFLFAIACSSEPKPNEPIFIYPFATWEDIEGEYASQNCGNGSYVEQSITQLGEWYEEGIEKLTHDVSDLALGNISDQFHESITSKFPIVRSSDSRRVRQVFKRLREQVPKNVRNGLEIYLVSSSASYNAFATPGGKCYITTALYQDLENEDEIAFVLGHEISHRIKDHGRLSVRQSEYLKANLGSNGGPVVDVILNMLTKPFNVGQEYEADQGGLWLMAQAGYNPEKGMMILSRWAALEESFNSNTFFQTHPAAHKRFGCCSTLTAEAKQRGKQHHAN